MSAAKQAVPVPLLKFHSNGEVAYLVDEGIAALEALPAPVRITAFMGDGRCGKSTLAGKLGHGDSIFPVGGTGLPVTNGIDLWVVPRSEDSTIDGSLVVLDCEGGNDPTGAIRNVVDLVAMLASTLTVQVVWGQTSEAQLQQIGQGLDNLDRILVGQPSCPGLPTQRLLLVVRGCHEQYSPDHLRATFLENHNGAQESRNELRAHIERAYPQIDFLTFPLESHASYPAQLEAFRGSVASNCLPATLAGSTLSGAQIAEVTKMAVREVQTSGVVPVVDVFRHVIYARMLVPLRDRLASEFHGVLEKLDNGDYRPDLPDMRCEMLHNFDDESMHLTHTEFVCAARDELEQTLDLSWRLASEKNQAYGEQIRDTTTEYDNRFDRAEDRVVGWKKTCGFIGPKKQVVKTVTIFRQWSRARMLKTNGELVLCDWTPGPIMLEGNGSTVSPFSASQHEGLPSMAL